VTLGGFTGTATVTHVSCVAKGHTVVVSGDLVGEGSLTTQSGVAALIYDSKGSYIGDGESPVLSAHPGQTVPFRFSASVLGTPASCTISWGFGPVPSGAGATSVGGAPSGGDVVYGSSARHRRMMQPGAPDIPEPAA